MEKNIIINSDRDYNSFLKKLLFYKYYKFTKFNITNNINKEEIDKISCCLNIKSRRKRIVYIYDEIINFLNEYYREDLCEFEDDKCFVQRKNNSRTKYGCCGDCNLVKQGLGCPTSNVSCKLLYCKPALRNIKKIRLIDIPITRCLSVFQRFMLRFDFFSTREQVINHLYFGLIYWGVSLLKKGLRITFRRRRYS